MTLCVLAYMMLRITVKQKVRRKPNQGTKGTIAAIHPSGPQDGQPDGRIRLSGQLFITRNGRTNTTILHQRSFRVLLGAILCLADDRRRQVCRNVHKSRGVHLLEGKRLQCNYACHLDALQRAFVVALPNALFIPLRGFDGVDHGLSVKQLHTAIYRATRVHNLVVPGRRQGRITPPPLDLFVTTERLEITLFTQEDWSGSYSPYTGGLTSGAMLAGTKPDSAANLHTRLPMNPLPRRYSSGALLTPHHYQVERVLEIVESRNPLQTFDLDCHCCLVVLTKNEIVQQTGGTSPIK